MEEKDYREIGKFIWKTYVPKSGQSTTVQGELLRAIEKLRDEAQRNGNRNWDGGHEILANFILSTLEYSPSISTIQKERLKNDIETILNHEEPYLEDDLYDRIERTIFDWYLANKEPISRDMNPNLRR